MCLVNLRENVSWGDAGIPALAMLGSTHTAVAGIFANGTPEQIGEWILQCSGTPEDIVAAGGGSAVSEPDAAPDVSSLKSRRSAATRRRTSGVLNGTKT